MSARRLAIALSLIASAGCATDQATLPEPGPAIAASVESGPVVASASGGGHWITPDGLRRRLAFSVRRHENGSVDGEWQLVAGPTIMHGRLSCLSIEGNTARVGGVVEQSKFSLFLVGTDVAWYVVDNGEGKNAEDETSNLRAFRNSAPGTAQAFCDTGASPMPVTPDAISFGNVQVRGE